MEQPETADCCWWQYSSVAPPWPASFAMVSWYKSKAHIVVKCHTQLLKSKKTPLPVNKVKMPGDVELERKIIFFSKSDISDTFYTMCLL